MRPLNFLTIVVLTAIGITAMGCDVAPPECARLCDKIYYAEELRADIECDGLRTSFTDTKQECRRTCDDAWDESSELGIDLDICLACINDLLGTRPSWDRVQWVIEEDCGSRCGGNFDFAWNDFACSWIGRLDYQEEPCIPDECEETN